MYISFFVLYESCHVCHRYFVQVFFNGFKANPRISFDPAVERERDPVGQRSVGRDPHRDKCRTIRFVGPALLRNTALSYTLTTVMEARFVGLPPTTPTKPVPSYSLTIADVRVRIYAARAAGKRKASSGKARARTHVFGRRVKAVFLSQEIFFFSVPSSFFKRISILVGNPLKSRGKFTHR